MQSSASSFGDVGAVLKQRIVCEILRSAGTQVLLANDGKQALPASPFPDDSMACHKAGINGHIEKAFVVERRFDVLSKWLKPAAQTCGVRRGRSGARLNFNPGFSAATVLHECAAAVAALVRVADCACLVTDLERSCTAVADQGNLRCGQSGVAVGR